MGPRRIAAWGLGALLLGGVSFACRGLVGIQDDPPQRLGPTGCGLPFAGDCASCVAASCCREASECAQDPSCAKYAGCLAASGGDPTLRAQCTYDNQPPATSPLFPPLAVCLATSCADECGLTCGGLAGSYSTPDAASACQDCLANYACPAEQACTQSLDCATVGLCALSCQGRVDCTTGCTADDDAGYSLFKAIATTFEGTCAPACASGQNWGCIGHVSWPPPQGSSTDVRYNLHDSKDSTTPVRGVQFALCSDITGTCGPTVGQSDDAGVIDLPVPIPAFTTVAQGPRGFLFLTTPDDAGDTSIVPQLVYWGAPLSQARLQGNTNVTTVTELTYISLGLRFAQDSGRGYLALSIFDCLTVLASGVVFDIREGDGNTQVFYLVKDVPSLTATQTDSSGVAVVANVPAGSVHVTARSLALGGAAVSEADVLVRPQTITNVAMVPSP